MLIADCGMRIEKSEIRNLKSEIIEQIMNEAMAALRNRMSLKE